MSVQNPMTINDLMGGASSVRFSEPRQQPPISRAPPPPNNNGRAGEPEDDFGYDLILDQRKKKKDDFGEGIPQQQQPENDEIWGDSNAQTDHYVDARERDRFEGNPHGAPDLPPMSPVRASFSPAPPNRMMSPNFRQASPRPIPTAASWDYPQKPQVSYEEMMEKRREIIEGLDKYRRRGLDVRSFPPDAPLEEMEMEYKRHKRAIDVEASIQFSRKMLMACVTGLEYVNERWDPLGLKLEGWSESVIEDIESYNDVFERLYDKYHTSTQMAPEFELLLMVAGSAFMFHLTNSMFKSAMPGMNGNNDMARTIRRGVGSAMSGAFSGAANGGGMTGMMSGLFGGGGGGGGGSRKPAAASPSVRQEMRGPSSDMDDLLSNLMDREPADISNNLVSEIDSILNNPSDEDERDEGSRSVRVGGPSSAPLDI